MGIQNFSLDIQNLDTLHSEQAENPVGLVFSAQDEVEDQNSFFSEQTEDSVCFSPSDQDGIEEQTEFIENLEENETITLQSVTSGFAENLETSFYASYMDEEDQWYDNDLFNIEMYEMQEAQRHFQIIVDLREDLRVSDSYFDVEI